MFVIFVIKDVGVVKFEILKMTGFFYNNLLSFRLYTFDVYSIAFMLHTLHTCVK